MVYWTRANHHPNRCTTCVVKCLLANIGEEQGGSSSHPELRIVWGFLDVFLNN